MMACNAFKARYVPGFFCMFVCSIKRSIHEVFQPKMLEKAHEYCAIAIKTDVIQC
jgi:hypothetical protein